MRTSTEIDALSSLVGEEKAVEYVAKAGFDAWDFSMFGMCRWNWAEDKPYDIPHPLQGRDYLKFARKLKQIGLDNGIICNQSHAPFPSDKPHMMDNLLRSIECTAEAGGKICVIHPASFASHEENAEMFGKIMPFARQHGVMIATENMFGWDAATNRASFAACATPEDFNAILDTINSDDFVACLDLGHAEIMGDLTNDVELIYALGKRLRALHIHDNDKWHDLHQIPFSQKIDFTPIAKALKDIGYKDYLTLEAPSYFNAFTAENAFDAIKDLYASVVKFDNLIASV